MSELEHQSALSRRMFLIGLAGTAVTFGFAPEKATAQQSGPFEPTIWYSVDRDGIVTEAEFTLKKAELLDRL